MRRVTMVAALVVVGGLVAAAVVFRPYLPTTCSDARRLDRILGGGLPVCLGKDGSQLDRYANGNHDDSSCSLVKTGPLGEYSYVARHDRSPCRQAGPVVTGCVALNNAASAPALARSARARIGGTWRLTIVRTPQGMEQQVWTSSNGLRVLQSILFDGGRTVCAEDRTAHAW